jgi:hypothetical protein
MSILNTLDEDDSEWEDDISEDEDIDEKWIMQDDCHPSTEEGDNPDELVSDIDEVSKRSIYSDGSNGTISQMAAMTYNPYRNPSFVSISE